MLRRDGGSFLWRQLWNALCIANVDMLCATTILTHTLYTPCTHHQAAVYN
jgi:hypothetical protein